MTNFLVSSTLTETISGMVIDNDIYGRRIILSLPTKREISKREDFSLPCHAGITTNF